MSFSITHSRSRGFTLIELMITVSIFAFMTALIMARYSSFYSGTIFNNIAYDVALTIKQAQTYGISVKATGGEFSSAYGVRFTHNSKEFTLFPYTKNNSVFDNGTLEKKYTLKQGAKFSKICGDDCTYGYVLGTGDVLDIIFQRPNPEAIVCVKKSSDGTNTCGTYKKVEIVLLAMDGTTERTVGVNSIGQVTVK